MLPSPASSSPTARQRSSSSSQRPFFLPTRPARFLKTALTWIGLVTFVLWLFFLIHEREDIHVPVHRFKPKSKPLSPELHIPPPIIPGKPDANRHAQKPDPPSFLSWWSFFGGSGSTSDSKPHGSKPLTVWDRRAEEVKDAFLYAYRGYVKYAEGYDELLPVSGGQVNNFAGWEITLHDCLDTMWIMGLRNTFKRSLSKIAKERFSLKQNDYAPFFETAIRHLGGLLSAYALSGEPILLSRADDLGMKLLPAFDTPSGLPMFAVNTVNGNTKNGWSGRVLWAEAMSNQMEYKFLAHLTGREEYYNRTERVMKLMRDNNKKDGLFASMWDHVKGTPSNDQYTVGAFADSAYEYLLKQWILTGRSEHTGLDMYLKAAKGIIENLLYTTPERNLLYVTDASGDSLTPSNTFEHLSCFLPGLFALGAQTLPEDVLSKEDREIHLWAAEGLAETCWATYADMKTGLGPDEMRMKPWSNSSDGRWTTHVQKWKEEGRPEGKPPGARVVKPESNADKRDYWIQNSGYYLRPETIETFYVLWRATGEVRWRQRGYDIFKSIQKHARTPYGFASVLGVDSEVTSWKDEMPSYFLAETLKYLYLLFAEEDLLPIDQWVFNTEAHPLPVFEWTRWEQEEWKIDVDEEKARS